jgi:hypothetical protein
MNYLFGNHDYLEHGISRGGVFYPKCLDDNRAGFLSTRQKWRLIWVVGTWIALAGLDLAMVAWMIYFQTFVPISPFVSLFWGTFLIGTAILCVKHAQPIVEDIRDGRVKLIVGQIRKYVAYASNSGMKGTTVTFMIETRKQAFDVTEYVYDSLTNHKTYRLAYIPRSNKLVNLESLEDLDEKKSAALSALQRKFNR